MKNNKLKIIAFILVLIVLILSLYYSSLKLLTIVSRTVNITMLMIIRLI